MSNTDSQEIVERFFIALDTLKKDKVIHGVSNFTDKYNINRRNLSKLRKDTARNIFQVAWIQYLYRDYRISLEWMINGTGNMYIE